MITVTDLVSGYGRLRVLRGVSVSVGESEVVTVLGGNGAGKSTLLKTIQGLLKPWSGRVEFEGRDITGLPAERVVRMGLALVPEGRELFPDLSVLDNLLLGAYCHRGAKLAPQRERTLSEVFELFPALVEKRQMQAATLSGGQQQMLAIGRALMSRPRALLLDEPSLGLSPLLVKEIFQTIAELRRRGVAVLLVEQNVRSALRIADRGYVLETGLVRHSASSTELMHNRDVQDAYLGVPLDRASSAALAAAD